MENSMECIVAMAVAAIAEELHTEVSQMRIVSFCELKKGSLEQYIANHNIDYKKYQLGE